MKILLLVLLPLFVISCGHAPVKTSQFRNFEAFKSGEYWGYRDKITNETVIAPVFDLAENFQEGLAPVFLNGKWGYIDEAGRIVIRPQYEAAFNFLDGQAVAVFLTAPATGYSPSPPVMTRRWIDKQGKTLFQASGVSNEGMEIISTPDRKYGYADNLNIAVRPELEDAKNCRNKLCLVKNNGKYAFIDYSGAVKITTDYDGAADARCGFHRVRRGAKYGFIDSTGTVMAPVIYDVLEEDACRQDLNAVLEGKFGIVRRSENWLFVEDLALITGSLQTPAPAAAAPQSAPVPASAAEDGNLSAGALVRENKAGYLVGFELNSGSRLLAVQTPLAVNVILKRRFNGKLRIYSTDLRKLVLLDVKKGEYLESMVLEVNGVPGKVFTVDMGLLPAEDFPGLLLGTEIVETASMRDKRYHARVAEEETINAPPGGDWFPEEGVENLLLAPQNKFGAARAKKLLACDPARAAKALPRLIRWFTLDGTQRQAAEEGLKTVIEAHGSGEAVAQLGALLKYNDARIRQKWLEGLRLCGSGARMAAGEIETFFEDENPGVRESAFSLYKDLGFALPQKYAEDKKNIQAAYEYTVNISSAEPGPAMEAIEKALENNPQDEENAKLYLLLGRLKKKNENDAAYARQHPGEYLHNEIGNNYVYNGKQFMHLLIKFPGAESAQEAAYELTELSMVGECEGLTACYIERQFNKVKRFLKERPGSKFADTAVTRANTAFTSGLKDVKDYNSATERYNPEAVKTLLREYNDLAALLPAALRVKAYLTIAGLWAKFLDYDRARKIYDAIISAAPDNETVKSAKESLAALPTVQFILSTAKVVGSSSVELQWAKPPLDAVTEYAVYRSSATPAALEMPGNFTLLTRLQNTRFTDAAIQPDTAYWYYLEALTPAGKFPSNRIYCRIPAPPVPPR